MHVDLSDSSTISGSKVSSEVPARDDLMRNIPAIIKEKQSFVFGSIFYNVFSHGPVIYCAFTSQIVYTPVVLGVSFLMFVVVVDVPGIFILYTRARMDRDRGHRLFAQSTTKKVLPSSNTKN